MAGPARLEHHAGSVRRFGLVDLQLMPRAVSGQQRRGGGNGQAVGVVRRRVDADTVQVLRPGLPAPRAPDTRRTLCRGNGQPPVLRLQEDPSGIAENRKLPALSRPVSQRGVAQCEYRARRGIGRWIGGVEGLDPQLNQRVQTLQRFVMRDVFLGLRLRYVRQSQPCRDF